MAALILFEIIVVGIFTLLLLRQQNSEMAQRMHRRLENQALRRPPSARSPSPIATLTPSTASSIAMPDAPASTPPRSPTSRANHRLHRPTSLGKIILSLKERSWLRSPLARPGHFPAPEVPKMHWEVVAPIPPAARSDALAWIYPNDHQDKQDLRALLRITAIWAVFVLVACTIIAAFLAQSITRQLGMLTRATRQPHPASRRSRREFPLPVRASTEAADLTIAFNRMVAAMQDQRAGLNETLALLDSMLANAPIGFAFFDRKYRFVRVNQFLADMNGYSFALISAAASAASFPAPPPPASNAHIETVFQTGEPVRNLELTWEPEPDRPRSWLAHLYPVRTETEATRWVGAILVDTTEQKRARRNPSPHRKARRHRPPRRLHRPRDQQPSRSRHQPPLPHPPGKTLPRNRPLRRLAAQEVARVSEITQQTLRFYRQSTLPALTNVSELLDSVITLHLGRIQTLQVDLHRDYAPGLQLFCFAGELRQLFANFIGNALDAMTPDGGRLLVRAYPSHQKGIPGIRFSIGDTGCGISQESRRHIFEPFYTTKEATGTGLGLWVSEQIIRKHHGSVRVRSRDHGATGTVFSIFFPATGVEPDTIPADTTSETVSS